jgi:hypothetical protein
MKKEIRNGNRRAFIAKAGVITGGMTLMTNKFSAASYNRIMGANEKIRMGFIGVGNRGSQLLQIFMDQPDCEIAALCDV